MAALALNQLLGAFLDAVQSTVSFGGNSSNGGFKQLQQTAVASPHDVTAQLSRLVDTLTSYVDGESQALVVSHLTPFLVDILNIVKTRAAGLRSQGTTGPACVAKISICCFLARVAETLPHMVGPVKDICLCEADGLLQVCPLESCSEQLLCAQLRSFRSLLKVGCISSHVLRSQVGQLLMLTGSYAKPLIFESLQLVCGIYHISERLRKTCLQKYLDDQALAELYYADSALASTYVAAPNSFGSFVGAHADAIISPFGDASTFACGYVLPRTPGGSAERSRLVMTSSTAASMAALLEAILLDRPFVVQGETGSGRSFLLMEAARLMGAESRVVELHLDDQTDSKALLGSYVCGDVPGEFVWRAGIVTEAVLQGRWLVIENIDKVSIDVASALASLLDNKKELIVWNQPAMPVHPCFRLIGVRQVDAVTSAAAMSLLPPPHIASSFCMRHFAYKWHVVTVLPPSLAETREILTKVFPDLFEEMADLLISIYSLVKSPRGGSGGSSSSRGDASLHLRSLRLSDLMKVASRLQQYSSSYNSSTRKLTFDQRLVALQEVIDVVAASVRSSEAFLDISYLLSQSFGISKIEFDDSVVNRVLDHESLGGNGATVAVGRVTLPRSVFSAADSRRFAVTRRSFESLERLAVCVSMAEAVLLVGETGSGKTTLVQELSALTGNRLLVQNLSLTTDSADFLGGVRPVKIREVLLPLYEAFLALFRQTFRAADNEAFLEVISESFRRKKWKRLLAGLAKASLNAIKKVSQALSEADSANASDRKAGSCSDDAKTCLGIPAYQATELQEGWLKTLASVQRLEGRLGSLENGTLFAFQEGLLLQAVKNGYWILLDEVNLAAAEILQGLGGVMDRRPVALADSSGLEVVPVHPDFRLFACMNPPNDVGKKELPESIRSKFTEMFVDEMTAYDDLKMIVARYVDGAQLAQHADSIIKTYLDCRAAAAEALVDSGGQQPRYSLRTLTRALRAAEVFARAGMQPFSRALNEGFMLTCEKMLATDSRVKIRQIFHRNLGAAAAPDAPYTRPRVKGAAAGDWVLIKPHWLRCGPVPCVDWAERDDRGITRFVLTPSVQQCVADVVAAVVADVAPILLQGPTSVGKTTIIEYLAARCGHSCIRINNHEHTDVQEYIGTYITNAKGVLEFNDGLLVRALRLGHWVILDELNLAPSDVLEALNRLLDDNRELLIPETGEVLRPHAAFRLFATQNPAGAYGGRKALSRAFRNRFVEISFCDLPGDEIEQIVTHSCGIPPQHSKVLVAAMQDLQRRRQVSSVFQGKHGMVTMRDLLKWGRRGCTTAADIAAEGYMILAERLRSAEERHVVESALRAACRISDPSFFQLAYALHEADSSPEHMCSAAQSASHVDGIALTKTMQRMRCLVSKGMAHQEPVLLIGDTGTGKTTVCQLIAALRGQRLTILNCHQSTEAADIIGGYRPVRNKASTLSSFSAALTAVLSWLGEGPLASRFAEASARALAEEKVVEAILNDVGSLLAALRSEQLEQGAAAEERAEDSRSNKRLKVDGEGGLQQCQELLEKAAQLWAKHRTLFEWQDGPLVAAMKNGDMILLDELNLAEDAVIERLNSVLESGREITLVEQGGASEKIVAAAGFRVLATMNPGNDFGKRELSPALRSRFTEVWVPQSEDPEEVKAVVNELLFSRVDAALGAGVAAVMVDFTTWLGAEWRALRSSGSVVSVREIANWTSFVALQAPIEERSLHEALVDGAHVVFFDCLGVGLTVSREAVALCQRRAISHLISLLPARAQEGLREGFGAAASAISSSAGRFHLGRYSIPSGPATPFSPAGYSHSSEYAVRNFSRVLRAMQIRRPVLLEGPPGVGKTTLITSLAALSGNIVVRINMSEQTELSDLLGADLPTDEHDGSAGATPQFKWRDGTFLDALKKGHWVLLDELNLAPQSVLEGLNACFDHREEIFIPELGQSFPSPPSFRVFCTQNPTGEGGRKGLPASFLSRFSRIYVDAMTAADMTQVVVDAVGPGADVASRVPAMVQLVFALQAGAAAGLFGASGSPWEFNVRDVLRWCELAQACAAAEGGALQEGHVSFAAYVLFSCRMRCRQDQQYLSREFERAMRCRLEVDACPPPVVHTRDQLRIGAAMLRSQRLPRLDGDGAEPAPLLGGLAAPMEALAHCIALRWPALMVGEAGRGKRRCVRHLAALTGSRLQELAVTSSTDSSDLLGTFEQSSRRTHLHKCLLLLESAATDLVCDVLFKEISLSREACNDAELVAIVDDIAASFAAYAALGDGEGDALQTAAGELLDRLVLFAASVRSCCSAERAASLDAQLCRCRALLLRSRSRGAAFEWVDGVITDAAERGHWVLISSANLCPASVLDRLNALLEPGGRVVLSESGADRVVVPHRDFRVFLSVDPQYGEVSRAMRNRCVEICFPEEQGSDAASRCVQGDGYAVRCQSYFAQVYALMEAPRMQLLQRVLAAYGLWRSTGRTHDAFALRLPPVDAASEASASPLVLQLGALLPLLGGAHGALAALLAVGLGSGQRWAELLLEDAWHRLARRECVQGGGGLAVAHGRRDACASDDAAAEVTLHVYAQVLARMGAGDELENSLVDRIICVEALGSAAEAAWLVRSHLLASAGCEEWAERAGLSLLPALRPERSALALQTHEQLSQGGLARALHPGCGDALLFLSAWRCVSHLLYVDRAVSLAREAIAQRRVDDLVTVSAAEGQLSLFCAGYALATKKLVASSKTLSAVRALYSVLATVDTLAYQLSALLVGQGFQQLLAPLRELLARRDALGQLLASSDCAAALPWARAIVGVRWVYKAVLALAALAAATPALAAPLRTATKQLDVLFSAMGELWQSSFAFTKVRLWKEGGRMCVPALQRDWDCAAALQAMLAAAGSAPSSREGREYYRLLCDWLGLYAVLYLPRAVVGVAALAGGLSDALVASLGARFDELPERAAPAAAEEEAPSSALSASSSIIVSHVVMSGIAHIGNLLAALLLRGSCSSAEAAKLRAQCKEVLSLGMRYSVFPPESFREMQMLVWAFAPDAAQGAALGLARALAGALDHRLSAMALLQEELLPAATAAAAPSEGESAAARMAQPVVAQSALRALDLSADTSVVTMSAFLPSKRLLYQLFRVVKATCSMTSRGEQHFASVHLLRLLSVDIVSSCRDFYQPADVRSAALRACSDGSFAELLRLELHLHTSSPLLSQLFERCLQPLLCNLSNATVLSAPNEHRAELGVAWMLVGILRAHLVLPAAPVDPVLKPQAKAALLADMLSSLERRIFSQSAVGVFSHGVPATSGVVAAAAEAEHRRQLLRACNLKIAQRPDGAPAFEKVFLELQDALQTIADVDSLLELPAGMQQLRQGATEATSAVARAKRSSLRAAVLGRMRTMQEKEANWQRSYACFAAKLSREMPEYEDVTSPFLAALRNISTGLAMVATSFVGSARDELLVGEDGIALVNSLWALTLRFPYSAAGLGELRSLLSCVPAAADAVCQLVAGDDERAYPAQAQQARRSLTAAVLNFALARIDCSVGGASAGEECYSLLRQALALFSALDAAEGPTVAVAAAAKEEGALSLQASHEVPVEEAEPTAEGAAAQTAQAEPAQADHLAVVGLLAHMLFGALRAARVSGGLAFSASVGAPACRPAALLRSKRSLSLSVSRSAALLLGHMAPTLPWRLLPALDAQLCAPLLAATAHKLQHMSGEEEPPLPTESQERCDRDLLLLLRRERPPADFRQDANYTELQRASTCIRAVRRRAAQLLEVFPDNEYLAVVLEFSSRLLSFDASSSVGKIFENATQLLKKMNLWQQFASREYSLAVEQQALVALIADWRRQQLGSWQALLRLKEVSYARCAARYMLPLTKVLGEALELLGAQSVPGTDLYAPRWLFDLQSNDGMALGEAVTPAFELVNNFLYKSNLGQFPTKLHLVRVQALQMASDASSPAGRAVASMLFNVWQYYEQFLHPARGFQDGLRAGCEQRVAEEVKMAKWDRVETYMESESVERSLRKIKGVVAEYQTMALEHPLSAIISSEVMGDLAGRSGDIEQCSQVPTSRSLFPGLGTDGASDEALIFSSNARLLATLRAVVEDGALASISLPSHPRLLRAGQLCKRINRYLCECLVPRPVGAAAEQVDLLGGSVRFGLAAARSAEELCGEVFSRIGALQASSSSRAVKQHALRDLLGALRDQGVSHLRGNVPSAARSMAALFAVPSPLLHETASDHLWSSAVPRDAFARAEVYHYRNVEELNQLRAQTSSIKAKDMSLRDAQLFLGLSENLFFEVLRVRCSLGEQMKACLALHAGTRRAELLSAAMRGGSAHYADTPRGRLHHSELRLAASRDASALVDSVFQLQSLLAAAIAANSADNVEDNAIIEPAAAADCSSAAAAVAEVLVLLGDLLCSGDSGGEGIGETAFSVGSWSAPGEPTLAQSLECLRSSELAAQAVLNLLEGARAAMCALVPEQVLVAVAQQATSCLEGARAVLEQLCRGTGAADGAQEGEEDVMQGAAFRVVELLSSSLEAALIGVQKLRLLRVAIDDDKGDGADEAPAGMQLCRTMQSSVRSLQALGAEAILSPLVAACDALAAQPRLLLSRQLGALLAGVRGAVQQSLAGLSVLLEDLCACYKSGGKLLYVCLRIFRNLLAKGYCSPDKEEEEGEGEGEGNDFEADGTGMGEGEGARDVTDEITNEEQLLGLKDDGDDEKDDTKPNSKEEEEDKAIEMSQDFDGTMEDVPDEKEGEEDDDGADDEEIDRQIGDTDDADAVDEKQWGSEDGDEEEEGGDEDIDGADDGAEQDMVEDGMHTKDDDEEEGKEGDGAQQEGEEAAEAGDAEMEGDPAEMEGADDVDGDVAEDGKEDAMDEDAMNDEAAAEEAEDGSQTDADGGGVAEEQAQEEEEQGDEDAGAGATEQEQEERYDPTFGVESKATSRPICEAEKQSSSLLEEESSANRGSNDDSGQRTSDASSAAAGDENRERSKSAYVEPPNPLDSKGSFNEKWERRLNLTEGPEREDSAASDDQSRGRDVGEYEFATEETYTDQTLSTSRDNNAGPGVQEGPQDEDSVVEKSLMKERQQSDRKTDALKEGVAGVDGSEDEQASGEDEALEASREEQPRGRGAAEEQEQEQGDAADEDMAVSDGGSDGEGAPLPESLRTRVAASRRDIAELRRLWQEYQRSTEPYAVQLCERLRLVLEPTLAARLKGDYKSGKRLNMRKIIGYVASGYKKDKIWLRRTRLAKRDYQIVLMIDNSSSMREAGHLAMSSVFTLAGALSRLEAGDISVVSFGQDFETIHPFGTQLNENSGVNILEKFDFTGDKTLLGASLEKILAELSIARASSAFSRSGGKAAMQLAFVISDARVDSDNKHQIARTIKELNEQGVLMVLVIIDSCADEQDSILKTKTVSFKGDKVVTTAYLDTVPFPYYVLIQNIAVLPDVIADTLKQWFQIAAASSN